MLIRNIIIIFLLLSLPGLASAASDQTDINEAITEAYNMGGGIVEIEGYFEIDGPIILKENVHLKGVNDATVKVSPDSDQFFVDGTGLIDQEGNPDGCEISGFTIDGNIWAFPTSWANSGKGDHNAERAIDLRGSSNDFAEDISIHDMEIINCYSDGIHITYAENVEIYNNFVSNCQHSAIYCVAVKNGNVKHNTVEGITSDSVRMDNCEGGSVFDNDLSTYKGDSNGAYKGGQNAIQIADQGYSHGGGSNKTISTNNIRVYNNTIDGEGLRDIWIDSTGKGVKDVYVYDNIIEDGGKEPTTPKSVKSSDIIKVSGYDSDAIQKAINSASEGDTIQLEAEEYKIDKQIVLTKGITLKGAMNGDSWETTFKLVNNADFDRQDPIIYSKDDDVRVCYIHLDGNSENQPSGIDMGDGYYNWIGFFYGENIEIDHNWIDNGLGDHIRLRSCVNANVHDNKITRAGHEGVFLIMCENSEVHDNYIIPRDNTAVRWWGGHSLRIYDNTIYFDRSYGTSCHAFQGQMDDDKLMSDIEVCGNYVSGMLVSAMWIVDKTGDKNEDPVWIHHNVFEDCGDGAGWGAGGIIDNGLNARIENNVFDNCQGAGVSVQSYNGAWGTDAKVTIQNNIFNDINTWDHTGSGGYAIDNLISADISTQNNCFFANEKGNTQGCSLSSSDCFVNPKTDDTECDITWDGSKWVIPGVKPQGLSGESGVYDDSDVSDEEIKAFDDIFDVLMVKSYIQVGKNDIVVLPEGIEESSNKALGKVEHVIVGNVTTTLVTIDNKYLEGVSEVRYEVNGVKETHTLMIGEKHSGKVVFTKTSLWSGDLDHSGDALRLYGYVDIKDINVECVTPTDTFIPILESTTVETEAIRIHPAIFFILGNIVFFLIFAWKYWVQP